MRPRAALLACGGLLLAAGAVSVGHCLYLETKGLLAGHLIERAFSAHLQDGKPHRPWAWADTTPIALLELDRLNIRRVVLAGASGTSMAFGVGHIDGTAPPNTLGNCVLAGHRDKEFAFLEDVRVGDLFRVRMKDSVRMYVVETLGIVPRSEAGVLRASRDSRLTLVTCYPFRGLRRSPWRYIVTATATGLEDEITISSSSGEPHHFF